MKTSTKIGIGLVGALALVILYRNKRKKGDNSVSFRESSVKMNSVSSNKEECYSISDAEKRRLEYFLEMRIPYPYPFY